jgi:hypothetical protein
VASVPIRSRIVPRTVLAGVLSVAVGIAVPATWTQAPEALLVVLWAVIALCLGGLLLTWKRFPYELRRRQSVPDATQSKSVHVQRVKATRWHVVHGLDMPTVTIYGKDGEEWLGPSVQHADSNTTDIDFGQPVSGEAFVRGDRLILRLNE